MVYQTHLKRTDKESEKDFDVAQNACCLLICGKDEKYFMNSKQRNEGESSLGEPKSTNQTENRTFHKSFDLLNWWFSSGVLWRGYEQDQA